MKADINITPLIDVLLVLLIIFMLVVPVTPSALDASLPERAGETSGRPAGIVVAVDPDAFSVDGVPVFGLAELERRLGDALAGRRERTVFVRVADGVADARVVEAIDAARAGGAERIGLVDAPAEADDRHVR